MPVFEHPRAIPQKRQLRYQKMFQKFSNQLVVHNDDITVTQRSFAALFPRLAP
ncbi:unnamed protein product [Anisakis simplex]|uniref:Uncharacterized protein n=1 Tax=Anisakis simplex TaxID=6269 RepID=A0A3P6PPU1_ANISI|nr:unnamed protein product [Anisakis simplex]